MDSIGQLYLQQGQSEKALNILLSSKEIAENKEFEKQLQQIYKLLSEIYEKQQNYETALAYERLYVHLIKKELNQNTMPLALSEHEINKRESKISGLQVKIILLSSLIIILVISSIFLYNRQKLKQKALIQQNLAEQQKLSYRAILEAQEQERKRIASDLHDSLGYMLSTAKLNMSGLEDIFIKHNDDEKKMFDNSIQLIDTACNEVRNISHNLMPGALIKLGLLAGVKDIVQKVNQSNKIKIKITANGLEQRLSENMEITVYRIIQELVNNIVKHSEATEAKIAFERKADKLIVQVNDNGKGIDINKLKTASGIGWKNINSRTSMMYGTINISSEVSKGTLIIIELSIEIV